MRSLLNQHNFNKNSILVFKLKRIRSSIKKKKLLYQYYYRLGYYSRRFSGRRRVRLNKFFFHRTPKLYSYRKKKLLFNFFFFLKGSKLLYNASKFLTANLLLLSINFYRLCVFSKKKLFGFFRKKGRYSVIFAWLFLLLKTCIPNCKLTFVNKLLAYRSFFLNKERRRSIKLTEPLCFKYLNSSFALRRLSHFSKLKKHKRLLRSLFVKLCNINLKKIFFITLRSSKNNTMLSIFDFFGNLLYWKTSKTVGMSGKKRGTKMAAEFLAYHLTRYLRSRRFYAYKFIFTLFGLHRHFKVVFRFIKRNIRSKNVIAMLARSRVPHGGSYIKKRKHKGRKKYHRRTSLYY